VAKIHSGRTKVFNRVAPGRRGFIKRLVGGAFAVPAIASFSFDLFGWTDIASAQSYPYPYPCYPYPQGRNRCVCDKRRGPLSVQIGFEARITKNGKIERGHSFHIDKRQNLTLVTVWDADVVGNHPVAQHVDVFMPDGSQLYPGPEDVSLSHGDIDPRKHDRLNPVSVLLSGIGPGSPVGRWFVHVSLVTAEGAVLQRCAHFELHC